MEGSATNAADATKIETDGAGASDPATGSTELHSLRNEGERLKLERNNAQLRAELKQLRHPWWRKGVMVTTLTAIVAAVVPVTTAVQACYQKARELSLQESRQGHEVRMSYLDHLEKPRARMRTLRFIAAVSTDSALQKWAENEKNEVQVELDAFDRLIKEVDVKIAAVSGANQGHTLPSGAVIADPTAMYDDTKKLDILIRLYQEKRLLLEEKSMMGALQDNISPTSVHFIPPVRNAGSG